jgi:hypothetical protein
LPAEKSRRDQGCHQENPHSTHRPSGG